MALGLIMHARPYDILHATKRRLTVAPREIKSVPIFPEMKSVKSMKSLNKRDFPSTPRRQVPWAADVQFVASDIRQRFRIPGPASRITVGPGMMKPLVLS